MKKPFLTILMFIAFAYPVFAREITLSKGAFIPVYPTRTLSTSVQEEGDNTYFIVPYDMWIDEVKIVPKNSIIKARISMLKMPIQGINAAMVIETENITFPSGEKYDFKGKIAYKGEVQIGGNLTPPASYNKSLHMRRGEYYNGVIAQYVPSGEYEFGQHVTIPTDELLQVVLDEEFHPLF